MDGHWRVGAALLAAGTLAAVGISTSGAAPDQAPGLPEQLAALVDPPRVTPVLPADPAAVLIEAVEATGRALGVSVDADRAVAEAGLAPEVSGRLALLTSGLLGCQRAAGPARAAVAAGREVPAATGRVLHDCAGSLQSLAVETADFLAAHPAADSGGLDLWPVLRYSPATADDLHEHDYAVLVDQGGNDRYFNNAAGSLLDLKRGPAGSVAPLKQPARGCQMAGLPGLEFPEECVLGSAVLVDAAGDDQYGLMQDPDPTGDGFCTGDRVVRRLFTGGSALAGVGVLVEQAGDDSYLGKTNALGAGHAAGVGILRDEAGFDQYVAIRASQGYGLAGVGLLNDLGGDDRFRYYAPGPLNPNAGYQRPGSGGVIDDRGTCDAMVRQLQGTGFLTGGAGLFVNNGGSDGYVAVAPATQAFDPTFTFPHGSQGFGGNGGFGYFLDDGGRDQYLGVPGRGDDTVVEPSGDSFGRFEDSASG